MEAIINYFETIPSLHRTLILVGGISFFWILEGFFPIVRFNYKKWKHSAPNFFFTFTTIVVNLVFAFAIVWLSDQTQVWEWGVFHWLGGVHIIVKLIIGVMLMDLVGAWLIHWTEHKILFLWRFHVVHHTDEHVDTTTALRHHPGESVFRAIFTCLAILIVGAPIWLVMLYQSVSAVFSQFNHSNLKLPSKLDKFISYVFVTPGMHRVHHHETAPYTDSNYGNIFSIWDRMTGNYSWLAYEKVKFGLDTYTAKTQDLGDLLKAPLHLYSDRVKK